MFSSGFLASMIFFKLTSATLKRPEASGSTFGKGIQPHSSPRVMRMLYPASRRLALASLTVSCAPAPGEHLVCLLRLGSRLAGCAFPRRLQQLVDHECTCSELC